MKVALHVATLAIVVCFAGAAQAQSGCARLSWNTCDPWVPNADFLGQGKYTLIESVHGLGVPNVGTDTQIHISNRGLFGVADAWRFDDAGCQAGRLVLNNNAFSKSCPAMKGVNAQINTYYAIYPDGTASLRLAIAYDPFAPIATTRYTLWQIVLDHTASSVGPTPADNSTCGGVEACEIISFDFVKVFTTTGAVISLPGCDDSYCLDALWQSWSCIDLYPQAGCFPVTSRVGTWGRLRATYR